MPLRSTDRSVTTCRTCRRRKIRCDRSRPTCARCRESNSLCVYEDQASRPVQEFRFVDEGHGSSSAALRLEPEEATTLQLIETLLERLRTTSGLLKAQLLAASTSGSDVESCSPRSIHASRRDAAFRADLWNSMRQDAAQLHASLNQAESGSPVQQRGHSLPSPANQILNTPVPIRSISEPNMDRLIQTETIDWGGLEQYFPELQEPGMIADVLEEEGSR